MAHAFANRIRSPLWHAGTGLFVMLATALLWTSPYPAHSAEAVPAPSNQPAIKSNDCERSAFRVVVDVGHTVGKPGADSSRGVTEYSFNLNLANEVMQALTKAGFEKAVRLITAAAPVQGLLERAERANRMRADLLLSIHHNSVPDNLLETWNYEGQQRSFSDRFKGYSLFISKENANPKGSLEFGHFLGEELETRGLHYTPHYTLPLMGRRRHELLDAEAGVYRYDQLVVLRKTLMSAVLMEAGSIINRDEELELASPERRALTSAAVAAAVEDFCATQARPSHDQQAKQPRIRMLAHRQAGAIAIRSRADVQAGEK